MLSLSGPLAKLQEHCFAPSGLIQNPLCIYGDLAYPLRMDLQRPFKGAGRASNEGEFNKFVCQVKVTLEWIFG